MEHRVVASLDEVGSLDVASVGGKGAVETHYDGEPHDVECAIAAEETFVVQSRPITSLTAVDEPPPVEAGRPLLQGLAASPGVATGVVRIVTSPSAGDELQRGEVLVGRMTSPDWVPTIRRAAALITEGGGMTCHAAIVARELGIPCVAGTRTATSTLRDGDVVTVDGARGLVFQGIVAEPVAATPSPVLTGALSEAPAALDSISVNPDAVAAARRAVAAAERRLVLDVARQSTGGR